MIVVLIKKNPQTASGRTRNRINEAGPEFILELESGPQRPNEMLLRSTKTGWFGWLPKHEIIILSREER